MSHIHMYACMFVGKYECLSMCVLDIYDSTCMSVHAYVYICLHLCMYVCMYVSREE